VPGRLDRDGFRSVVVGADALVPACSPGFALPAAGRIAVLDYSAESGLGRVTRALRASTPAGLQFDIVFTAHLATVLRTMALQGRGVAWLPHSLIADDLAGGRLVEAQGLAPALQLEVRLYRRDEAEPEAAEAFWRAVTTLA
jgi:DNA-binding transcriptional LysR family regulator